MRKTPTKAEKLAATLLELQRLRGDPIDREHAKAMTAEQICSLFQFDHAAGYACHGADNHPTGLTPLLIADHREKTRRFDVKAIAKVKRIKKAMVEFKRQMLVKAGWGEDASAPVVSDRDKKAPRLRGRGFQKRPAGHKYEWPKRSIGAKKASR